MYRVPAGSQCYPRGQETREQCSTVPALRDNYMAHAGYPLVAFRMGVALGVVERAWDQVEIPGCGPTST